MKDPRIGAENSSVAYEMEAHPTSSFRAVLSRLPGVRNDERPSGRRAADRGVAEWLDRLPEGWYVLHDVPAGERGAPVDHLVVGPAGAFIIASKELPGRVLIGARTFLLDGRRTDFLSRAMHDARHAARCLSDVLGEPVEVHACLAVTADHLKIKPAPQEVVVDTPRKLERWLLARQAVLSDEQVARIASAATKPETWAPSTRARG